ncbi:MAG TPA: UrcA family protein [Steroidobacteraceae bacterium]
MKTVNYSKNIALATTAAVCLASLGMTAHADESDFRVPARMVHFSDLNLNTQAGAEVLYKRIRTAAEAVCGDVDSRRLDEAAAAKACVGQAVAASIRAVNSPRLTNTYNVHVGVVPATIRIASLR